VRAARPFGRLRGEGLMNRLVQLFSKNDADNRAVEYGVIAAGLALALVAVLAQLGGALTTAL
jgi:Flp pilus assembly pilin Flp